MKRYIKASFEKRHGIASHLINPCFSVFRVYRKNPFLTNVSLYCKVLKWSETSSRSGLKYIIKIINLFNLFPLVHEISDFCIGFYQCIIIWESPKGIHEFVFEKILKHHPKKFELILCCLKRDCLIHFNPVLHFI